MGYSDVTVLHNRLNRLGYESVHSSAPLNFLENTEESLNSIFHILENKGNEYKIAQHQMNIEGEANAEVVGGNLAIIASLVGTNDDLDTANKILFIEDIGEAIYAVDRMMWTLKKSNKLASLAGLIVGGMTGTKDSEVPFGKTVEEVICDAVKEYNFPLCFNFPAGHIDDNRAIILGRKAKLSVNTSGSSFKQD
jgi:muramoyltetrapeptide carboxypeptidase